MTTFHEFNPVIYPYRLWVAINPEYKEYSSRFQTLDMQDEPTDITEEEFMRQSRFIASTSPVYERDTLQKGCVIFFRSPDVTVDSIAHESVHFADYLCEQTGINCNGFIDGEPKAYIAGWAASCIEKVVKEAKEEIEDEIHK